MTRLIHFLMPCLLLTACATPPDPDCTADWRETGRVDGRLGRAVDAWSDHAERCPGLDPAARTAWHEGWESGIQRYCTAQNGLDEGLAGEARSEACPDAIARPYRGGYRLGTMLAEAYDERATLQAEVAELEAAGGDASALRQARERLAAAERRIGELERHLTALGLGLKQ